MSIHNGLIRLTRLVPALAVMLTGILLLTGAGCGKGLFPIVNSASATVTPTPLANKFVWATNFNDGIISSFKRNATTGALTYVSQISAGAASGPMGLAVTAASRHLYVANSADNSIHEFRINLTSSVPGSLVSIGSIAAGTSPQMVALDTGSNFLYATNAGSKSISEYELDTRGSGALTLIGTVTGFTGKPVGIIAHPGGGFFYVTDNTAGVIYTFTMSSNGQLTQLGTATPSRGLSIGQPELMAIANDSGQYYLMVDDIGLGVVSVFVIQSDGSLLFSGSFGTGQSMPVGIGAISNSSTNYVFTANVTGNFVQPYVRTLGTLTQAATAADSSAPTGLVIDTQGLFVYTGNAGNGTIAQLAINGSSCRGQPLCLVRTVNSEKPANASAGTQFLAISK